MSVVEIIISVTLPVMTTLLLTAVWMLIGGEGGAALRPRSHVHAA